MKKIIIYLLPLFLMACGSSTTSNTEESNSTTEESCLADLIAENQIEKMITLESIAEITGEPTESIEVKDNKSQYSKYSTIAYQWEPDEPRKMVIEVKSGERVIKMENEIANTINIGNLDIIDNEDPLAYFNRIYGPKTEAEKEQTKKDIDRASENSDKVDKQSAESLKKMVGKQNSKQVDNVGDQAFWSAKSINEVESVQLKVLHGNVTFEVTTDVSKDAEEDLAMAKQVAQQVISQCK